jgi:hypothetical protein
MGRTIPSYRIASEIEIINGFLQKPIKIEDLCLEVNKQLNIYDYMFCSVQRMTD